jgi:hypothetical protein
MLDPAVRTAQAALQGAPASAPAASSAEHRRSSYVLQFQSSSANNFTKPAAAAFTTQQQQQQLGVTVPSSVDAGAVDGGQQQLDAALPPDGPDSPQPGQALLDAAWTHDEGQQQQVIL